MNRVLLIIAITLITSCSHQKKYPFEEFEDEGEEYVIEHEEYFVDGDKITKKKEHFDRFHAHDFR